MAVGDDTTRAGWSLVPDSGEDGRVKWGAREINRTRDYLAKHVLDTIQPVGLGGTGATNFFDARENLGIFIGTGDPPADLPNAVIYFKIL